MTTKGQMNPTSRASITASQAGENSQTNGSELTILSSILTDLILKEAREEEQYRQLTVKPAKKQNSSNEFHNSKLTQISPSTPT
jgi:hypothetical protein